MVDVDRLRLKMKEKKITAESLAKEIGIDKSTFYRKLANEGETFTVGEVNKMAQVLKLSKDEVTAIFFAKIVA